MQRWTVWLAAAWIAGSTMPSVRAEVVDEIVAWVDGDIITKSELDDEERLLTEELYRRFTGNELDQQLAEARSQLLQQLIDRKILMRRAERLFDMDALGKSVLDDFKKRQGIGSDDELARLLQSEGISTEELTRRLLEGIAPNEIIRIEVENRVSVSDQEVEQFYRENPDLFRVPAEFTLREIVLLTDESNKQAKLEQIQKLHAEATQPGADFEALAKEHSDAGTASSGGLLGPAKKGDLSPELERAALDTPVGQVSEILEMSYGFHFVRVEARTEERLRGLDEVRDTIRANLENRKYVELLQEFLARAREESEWRVSDKYLDRL